MRVLVTGGTGYLGAALVRALHAAGHAPVVFARRASDYMLELGRLAPQAGGNLTQTFKSLLAAQTDIAWIGYTVPVDDRDRTMCCFSSAEGTRGFPAARARTSSAAARAGSSRFLTSRAEGIPLLIDVARKNQNPAVRKQAIFWLGQSRDPRALDFFTEILK